MDTHCLCEERTSGQTSISQARISLQAVSMKCFDAALKSFMCDDYKSASSSICATNKTTCTRPSHIDNTLAECSHYTGLDRLVYAKSVTTTLNKTRPDDLPFCPNYIALCMWHLALINSMDAFFKAVGMITPCSHALSDSRESLIWKMISVVLLIVLRVNVCFNLRLSVWLWNVKWTQIFL